MARREHEEPARFYQHIKAVFGEPSRRGVDARRRRVRELEGGTIPYGQGREPTEIGDVLGALTQELGWSEPLAQSELLTAWPEVAGPEMAAHALPVTIEDGALIIRCDSSAWATQLRIMRATIVTMIAERYPNAGVESIRVSGPEAPSWKRGLRSVQGRGPRDTYG